MLKEALAQSQLLKELSRSTQDPARSQVEDKKNEILQVSCKAGKPIDRLCILSRHKKSIVVGAQCFSPGHCSEEERAGRTGRNAVIQ